MSGVSGDFKALRELREKLGRVASGEFARKLMPRLGQEAIDQVHQEFRQGRSPYGADWRPSERAVKEHGQTLRDTGRLLNSFSAHPTSDGFDIRSDVEYAAIHQYGGTIHRRSQTLIFGSRGRFKSRSWAISRKRGSIRFARSGEFDIHIPQRQMIPEGNLGWRWRTAFRRVLKDTFAEFGLGA